MYMFILVLKLLQTYVLFSRVHSHLSTIFCGNYNFHSIYFVLKFRVNIFVRSLNIVYFVTCNILKTKLVKVKFIKLAIKYELLGYKDKDSR